MLRDIHAEITNRLIEVIEANPSDPVMPWHRGGSNTIPCNVVTGQDYHGINVLNLWVVAQAGEFSSNTWGTFRQWKTIGAPVRKGQKSTPVVFYKQITRKNEDGEEEVLRILKYSSVFNAAQVNGWTVVEPETNAPICRIDSVETVIESTGAHIVEGGDQACYNPATDTIYMPDTGRFYDAENASRTEAFYAVLLHELTHWTGHPARCDRDLMNRFGSEAYAMEELVALS